MALALLAGCDSSISYEEEGSPLSKAQISKVDRELVDFSTDCDNGIDEPSYMGRYKSEILDIIGDVDCDVNLSLECDYDSMWAGSAIAKVEFSDCKKPEPEIEDTRLCVGDYEEVLSDESLISSR